MFALVLDVALAPEINFRLRAFYSKFEDALTSLATARTHDGVHATGRPEGL
jgi:hypothetical protein